MVEKKKTVTKIPLLFLCSLRRSFFGLSGHAPSSTVFGIAESPKTVVVYYRLSRQWQYILAPKTGHHRYSTVSPGEYFVALSKYMLFFFQLLHCQIKNIKTFYLTPPSLLHRLCIPSVRISVIKRPQLSRQFFFGTKKKKCTTRY